MKRRSGCPLRARCLPLTGVATSGGPQLGIIWCYSSSYILYSNRVSLTGVVNIRLLVITSRILALLYHISLSENTMQFIHRSGEGEKRKRQKKNRTWKKEEDIQLRI